MVFLHAEEEGIEGGLAVLGPPPLAQAVLDSQWVSHVQVLDQFLGSRFVDRIQALLPVCERLLQDSRSRFVVPVSMTCQKTTCVLRLPKFEQQLRIISQSNAISILHAALDNHPHADQMCSNARLWVCRA